MRRAIDAACPRPAIGDLEAAVHDLDLGRGRVTRRPQAGCWGRPRPPAALRAGRTGLHPAEAHRERATQPVPRARPSSNPICASSAGPYSYPPKRSGCITRNTSASRRASIVSAGTRASPSAKARGIVGTQFAHAIRISGKLRARRRASQQRRGAGPICMSVSSKPVRSLRFTVCTFTSHLTSVNPCRVATACSRRKRTCARQARATKGVCLPVRASKIFRRRPTRKRSCYCAPSVRCAEGSAQPLNHLHGEPHRLIDPPARSFSVAADVKPAQLVFANQHVVKRDRKAMRIFVVTDVSAF